MSYFLQYTFEILNRHFRFKSALEKKKAAPAPLHKSYIGAPPKCLFSKRFHAANSPQSGIVKGFSGFQ